MPKNSKSGRGKVSLLLCAVTVITTSVILAVGIFSSTSRTKEILGIGSDERPYRGRILLSVLKNWTLPGYASQERVDKLWGRFLEKVKKAVGRLATSTTTATSGSRRSSNASKTSRSVVTSTTVAVESTLNDADFRDDETATVDYEYTTPGSANASGRLRRKPTADRRGTTVTTPRDEIAAFFNHSDGFASDSYFRSTTNDSNEGASSKMDPLSPTVTPGTVLAIADGNNPDHQESFQTNSSLAAWESNQDVSNASTAQSKKTRGLKNNTEERVDEKPFLEARGRGETRGSELLEDSSKGSTVDSPVVQERRQGLVAVGTSYGRGGLKPREALDLVKAHVETGSAIFRDGVDWIEERLPAPSASDAVKDSSNLPNVETVVSAEPPRRGLAAEGQRLLVSGAGFSFSDREEGSHEISSDSTAAAVQPNRNSPREVVDVDASGRWSGRLSDTKSSLLSEDDTRKATARIERPVSASNWQGLDRFPETTVDDEEQPPPTKNAKYKGSSSHSNVSLADARRSGRSETGSLPDVVHTNASDPSVGSSSEDSSSPASDEEQRQMARDLGNHSSLPTLRENDADPKPPNSLTYVPEVTTGDESGEGNVAANGKAKYSGSNNGSNGSLADARSLGHSETTGAVRYSPGQLLVSEISEKAKAFSNGHETELRRSGVSDERGDRFEGGGSSANTTVEPHEGPLLELRATNSEPPHDLSPAGRAKGVGRYRMTESTGAGTEPFQEFILPEEETTLAANKESPRVITTLHSHRDEQNGFTLEATSSRETELFDLSRELDRIAHEFTDFLKSKAKGSQSSSSEGHVSTSVGPEEPFRADGEITTVAERDDVPAESTSAVVKNKGVATTAQKHMVDSTNGGAGSSTVSQAREEDSAVDIDEETRPNVEQTTSVLVKKARPTNEDGQIYCSVGPAYTGPLPPALCSYFLVYSAVQYSSNRKSFQVTSKGSWRALVNKANRPKVGPRVLLVLNASHVQNMVADFPVPVVFATKAQSFIEARGLWGLAFDLSLATDYDARSHAMLLRETKGSLPRYHFVGLMDFFAASGLLRVNLAVLVGSVHKVFLRHDPQRVYTIGTSVPNPFASPNRRSYSVENAMRLAESLRLVSPDHNQVCLSVSLAVYKFSIYTMDANYSSPGVGSLAFSVDTGFSYAELCKNFKGLHTHFDDASLSTYVHKGSAWLGFDDDTSMEIKIDKLSRGHRVGCLLADHIDLDDYKNVCKKGDFPRLRLLKRTFSSRV